MLNVFFTVDTEVWCGGWTNVAGNFPDSFRRYIYGPTASGEFGLRYQMAELTDNGLTGVFFVEPLFSFCVGRGPLDELVGLIRGAGHEVQLHMHTEWVDESKTQLLPDAPQAKRQNLRDFSLPDQTRLISLGLEALVASGAERPNAFRAGNFGMNADTLRAVGNNGMSFDSSYNGSLHSASTDLEPGQLLCEPLALLGVWEYPMTVYRDRPGNLRHAQVAACSFRELEHLLWKAHEEEREAFVILFHNFELLDRSKERADRVMVSRFRRLCRFLGSNRNSFHVRGFHGLTAEQRRAHRRPPLRGSAVLTALRFGEQLARRFI